MVQAGQGRTERRTVISVLIATRNRGPELETLLGSLRNVEAPDGGWELLVIDNGSSDGTAPILRSFAAEGRLPLRPLWEPRRGKSRALNLAVPAARGDVLAFTDDDVVVQPQWLRAFERAAARHPEAIGFAGRAPALGGPTPRGHGIVNYDHGNLDFEIKPFERPPLGVNVAFRRLAFERYGLFREDLGPGSPVQRAEDTEFVRRLWLGGERLRYVADAVAQHPVHKERLSRRFSLRHRFRVGRSNARMTGRPAAVPTVGGVPRYLYGSILRGAARVALSTVRWRWGADFVRAQRLAYDLGLAYEFRSLPRNFDPRALVPAWRMARDHEGPTAGARA
jgi:glycosyltransferase involved in cell wall biosynthesis